MNRDDILIWESYNSAVLDENTSFDTLLRLPSITAFHASLQLLSLPQLKYAEHSHQHLHLGSFEQAISWAEFHWGEIGTTADFYLHKLKIDLRKLYPEVCSTDDPEEDADPVREQGYHIMAYHNTQENVDDYRISINNSRYNDENFHNISLLILNKDAILSIKNTETLSFQDWYKDTWGDSQEDEL